MPSKGVAGYKNRLFMLPNLQDKEKDTLYIIGNGFDLYHNIKSKYRHFCSWLNLNDYENFVDDMEWFFLRLNYQQCNLWSNFENVLRTYDSQELYHQLRHKTEDVWNDEALRKSVEELSDIVKKIRPLMKEWASNIDIKHIPTECRLELSKESLFLTFNYTKVLENFYGIPESQICHIHGSIDDEEILTGHDITTAPHDVYAETDEEELPRKKIVEIMNTLNKNITNNIKKNSFFDTLQNISNIVVIGHSMSIIDIPYFHAVRTKVCPNSNWYFSIHDGQETRYINSFIENSSHNVNEKPLQMENCHLFKL